MTEMIDPGFQKDTEALQRVLYAGMRLLYDPKTFPMFKEGITSGQPLSDILAIQTAGLVKMLDKKAGGKIPKNIIAPAAVMLLAEIARFMNEAGLVTPTEEEVKAGISKMLEIIMKVYSPVSESEGGGQAPQTGQAEPEPQPPQGGGVAAAPEGAAPAQGAPAGLLDTPMTGG